MRQSHINKLRGGGIREEIKETSILPKEECSETKGIANSNTKGIANSNTNQLTKLSENTDSRVKKLKKELQKLDISPKQKYIKLVI